MSNKIAILIVWSLTLLPSVGSGINYDYEIVEPAPTESLLQAVRDIVEIISYLGSITVSLVLLIKNKFTLKKLGNFFDKVKKNE